MALHIEYAHLSKQGDREYNEDCVGIKQEKHAALFALADGLGGHGEGDVASKLVVGQVDTCEKGEPLEAHLSANFENAQKKLLEYKMSKNRMDKMLTTLVLLEITEEQCIWGHVGDSRLYYFEDGVLKERTKDHSVPQMLAAAGEITDEQIRHHPDRNRLLRSMGILWDEAFYKLSKLYRRDGAQQFLLCSDGFWEYITEEEMEDLLKKADNPREWMESMERVVMSNGSEYDMDNYSAIAVWSEV